MNEIYLTTDELSQRIKYDARTIRNCLKDSVLLEGIHYFRPFGGRKILFIWEAVERDMVKFSRENGFGIPMANGGSAVGKIVARKETGNLFFDFRYLGKRCREQTALPDTPTNRKKLEKILERIEAEITRHLRLQRVFPAERPCRRAKPAQSWHLETEGAAIQRLRPTLVRRKKMEWRDSHTNTVRLTLEKYLLPTFGKQEVSAITKADILAFRSALGKVPGQKGQSLTATRINHIRLLRCSVTP